MPIKNLSQHQQATIVKMVKDTCEEYERLNKDYINRMDEVAKEVYTFEQAKERPRDTTFKVNKAFGIINKAVSKILARPIKWIATFRTEKPGQFDETMSSHVIAIQDYLTSIFDNKDFREVAELYLRGGLTYGTSFAKATYDYKISRYKEPVKRTIIDEETGEEMEVVEKKVKEKVAMECPLIEYKKYSQVYYDPRILRLEDMPSIIDRTEGVRIGYILSRKDRFMNLDDLMTVARAFSDEKEKQNRGNILQSLGVNWVSNDITIDPNKLDIKCFYGLFEIPSDGEAILDTDGTGEKLYEFWTVNDILLLYAEEITEIPFEDFRCFKITEKFNGVGYVEPIMGIQKEMNFKKNKAAEHINRAMHPTVVRSPNSGINPKQLHMGPGNIIRTSKDAVTALENFQQLEYGKLDHNYFAEQNDIERQVQDLTHSVDASAPRSEQGLTNTATGIRIKAFESNSVTNYVRSNFENALERLAYKFLNLTFESLDEYENLIIKKTDSEGYWKVHKEVMKDALSKYAIKIEAGSSAFDSLDQKREDAIAQWNIAKDAALSGVPVDLEATYKRLMSTFEGVDQNSLIKQQNPLTQMQQPVKDTGELSTKAAGVPNQPAIPALAPMSQ